MVNCCSVTSNGALSGGVYGANLSFTAAAFVYQVAIVDNASIYGGATLPHLSGTVNGNLDVVLYKLPPPTKVGVGFARTTGQLKAAIAVFPRWNEEEKQAMLSVVGALSSIRGTADPVLRNFTNIYETTLNDRGIDPAII